MTSHQASAWRDMAKEAIAAADRIGNPDVRQKVFLMAARYMAMAQRVEDWTAADQSEPQ
jgi:hypothetical protein